MAKTYDIAGMWNHFGDDTKAQYIVNSSDADLEKWAADPNCNQQALCLRALEKRIEGVKAAPPFDPRREVSADARHIAKRIITHMWGYFRRTAIRSCNSLRDFEMRHVVRTRPLFSAANVTHAGATIKLGRTEEPSC